MKLTTKYLLALITTILLLNLSVAEARSTSGMAALKNKGDKGDTGPIGPQGPAGTNGSSFSYSMTCGVSGTDACKIGSVGPGGGWIFFVDYNNQYSFNYLEAAPTDIIPDVPWCVGAGATNSIYTPAPSVSEYWALKGVGQGAANTVAMKSMCTSGAAYSASTYTNNGKSDWFLPSLGEMKLMYDNLLEAGVGGFANSAYWSSTEGDSVRAWVQHFINGNQLSANKTNTIPVTVRAVRAF
jgi:hypothetical protein